MSWIRWPKASDNISSLQRELTTTSESPLKMECMIPMSLVKRTALLATNIPRIATKKAFEFSYIGKP